MLKLSSNFELKLNFYSIVIVTNDKSLEFELFP
jgi:hypothetical protein